MCISCENIQSPDGGTSEKISHHPKPLVFPNLIYSTLKGTFIFVLMKFSSVHLSQRAATSESHDTYETSKEAVF